MSFGPYKLIQS